MTTDLGEHKQYSDARSREGADQKLRDAALGNVMVTVEGRKLMWWLLERCRLNDICFAGENTHITAFQLGERNIGNQLYAELNQVCPNLLLTMTVENTKSKEIRNARIDPDDTSTG